MNRVILAIVVLWALFILNEVNNERISIGVEDKKSLDILNLCANPEVERHFAGKCSYHKKRLANWIVIRSVEAVFARVGSYFINPLSLGIAGAGFLFLLWIMRTATTKYPYYYGDGPIYYRERSGGGGGNGRVGPPRYGQVVMIGDGDGDGDGD